MRVVEIQQQSKVGGYESQICHMHTILFLSHLIATLPTPHGLVGIKLSNIILFAFYLFS
jgi:hypothetical protein